MRVNKSNEEEDLRGIKEHIEKLRRDKETLIGKCLKELEQQSEKFKQWTGLQMSQTVRTVETQTYRE